MCNVETQTSNPGSLNFCGSKKWWRKKNCYKEIMFNAGIFFFFLSFLSSCSLKMQKSGRPPWGGIQKCKRCGNKSTAHHTEKRLSWQFHFFFFMFSFQMFCFGLDFAFETQARIIDGLGVAVLDAVHFIWYRRRRWTSAARQRTGTSFITSRADVDRDVMTMHFWRSKMLWLLTLFSSHCSSTRFGFAVCGRARSAVSRMPAQNACDCINACELTALKRMYTKWIAMCTLWSFIHLSLAIGRFDLRIHICISSAVRSAPYTIYENLYYFFVVFVAGGDSPHCV